MTEPNRYKDCLAAMYGLRRFGIILGLETIRDILSALDNPQDRYQVIHVAGTNGKGSVASALANILHSAGFTVGLYTSPHLVRFNERICIDNRPISDDDVVRAYEEVRRAHTAGREPTFFEFATAMAFFEFGRRKVDWAVIETGMGGRLDATNVVHPALSVITNISLEHQEYLGETLLEITAEKAGIIKPGIPVITGVDQEEAIAVIEKTAAAGRAPMVLLNRHFHIEATENGEFTYAGIDTTWRQMRTGLAGRYQLDNAAMVLAGCEVLIRRGVRLPPEAIQKGLAQNRWPGRLEIVSTSPFVIIDGAHNLAAAQNLAVFLQEELGSRKLTLVVGILDDKPYRKMLATLLPICRKAILTAPDIHRAVPAETLYEFARTILPNAAVVSKVSDAVRHAMENTAEDEAVCIAGSLYVVGEAKSYLEPQGFPSFKRTADA